MSEPVHISVPVKQVMALLASGQPVGTQGRLASWRGFSFGRQPEGKDILAELRRQIKERGIGREMTLKRRARGVNGFEPQAGTIYISIEYLGL